MLVAPRLSLEPTFMIVIQLKGFMAAVLGGMNSIVGAVFGGFLLGLIENLVAYYMPQIKDSFSLILIVLVLLFLPSGIFGKREVRRA
jgi:branched-chain amino acid transport system permease protein